MNVYYAEDFSDFSVWRVVRVGTVCASLATLARVVLLAFPSKAFSVQTDLKLRKPGFSSGGQEKSTPPQQEEQHLCRSKTL